MEKLDIFGRNHVMLDLETFSTQQNAVIISIGAVSFTFEEGIKDDFLINVDPISCHKIGLHTCPKTLIWWSKQPKEVSDMWKVSPKPIHEALEHLNKFIGVDDKQWVWAQGSVFDHGILRSAFAACKIEQNWKYWQENDSRTIFNVLGVRNDKLRAKSNDYHSALGDARAQANTLIGLLT